jgi:outer membrane protein
MKRQVVLIVVSYLSLILAPSLARGELKIGVVDLQKALEMCSEGKKAKSVFSKKVEKVQAELKAKQDELDTLKGELERQGTLLSEDARADKERTYQYKLRDFQRLYKDSQEELQRQDAEMSERILKGLQGVIEKLGKQGEYNLILERSHGGVLYSSSVVDVTDQVIKMYDTSEKSAKSP